MNGSSLTGIGTLLLVILVAVVVITVVFIIGLYVGRKKNGAKPLDNDEISGSNTRFMITLSHDAIVITDTNLKVLNLNARFRELLSSEIVMNNQNLSELLKTVNANGEQVNLSGLVQFKNGDVASHDQLYLLDRNNEKVEMTVQIFKMHTKTGPPVLVWKMINTSEEKGVEKEQNEFISVISHELRTPVAVMEASTSSLLSNTNETLTPNQSKLVNATRENALLLSKLLADLSVYSNLQHGDATTEMSSVSPRLILDQMQKIFTSQAEEKGLVLVVDHDQNVRSVISGEAHILSILQNFIKNALQFSNPGGIVIISTKAVSDGVIFMVRDTGTGIAEQQREHIFENTFHANTDTQHQTLQGAGVGLYISSQLARAIGATIWVESETTKGSSFFLKVPISYDAPDLKQTVHNLEINKFAQDI